MTSNTCKVKYLGTIEYQDAWEAMKCFTNARTDQTPDEIWIVEHPPVYTLGQAGKAEHLLKQTHIPVIRTDRGGQITYHGPGQLIVYTLINIKRKGIGIRALVSRLEDSVIALLKDNNIPANSEPSAPGIYVGGAKICSIGLRIRKGCSFHGLALNVDMDLSPFRSINPCGYPGMQVIKMTDFKSNVNIDVVSKQLIAHLMSHLGYNNAEFKSQTKE